MLEHALQLLLLAVVRMHSIVASEQVVHSWHTCMHVRAGFCVGVVMLFCAGNSLSYRSGLPHAFGNQHKESERQLFKGAHQL